MEGTEEGAAQRCPHPARPSQPATEMEVTPCPRTPVHRWGGLGRISQGLCPGACILIPHLHPLPSEEAGAAWKGLSSGNLKAFFGLHSFFLPRLHGRLPPGALRLHLWSPPGLAPHTSALQPAPGCPEPGEEEDGVGFNW